MMAHGAKNEGAAMATILEFRNEGRAGAGRSRNLPGACEIVLFPGVRYEYTAPAAPAKTKRKASRKRDRIVLQD